MTTADEVGQQAGGPPFELAHLARFAELALQALGEAREEIDALNVYPVPDGDTGTNMYLTLEAGHSAVLAAFDEFAGLDEGELLRACLKAYSRGTFLGARGNSGVILGQLVDALFRRISASGPQDRAADVAAEGLRAAAEAAYAAVGEPVEGTILTVARAAADAAVRRAEDPAADFGAILHAAAAAAHEALLRTPDQLPVLKAAGVVDAGGRGLCVVLDAAETAVTGQVPSARPLPRHIPVPAVPTGDLTEDGPAYEVMYLLDADDDAVAELKRALGALGDSLVVVGGDGQWNVHVHVDDVGPALEAGIRAGRPSRIQVTHFAEQVARHRERRERKGRSLVAVVAGEGLAEVFREAGATVILGGPGRRPSTGQLLEAILESHAREVVVLPNDGDSIAVAEAAAREAEEQGVNAVVVPTKAQVQGIAALAVHEPGRSFEGDVVAMTAAAREARHGAVTVAAKTAITSAGPCDAGDALGVVQGDFAVVGSDLHEVAVEVLGRLLGSGGELVTLVSGEGGLDLAAACEEWLEDAYPLVDVVVLHGGQERYPLLLSVE